MKTYVFAVVLLSLFSALSYAVEGTKISVHRATLGVEFHTEDGGPHSSVGIDREEISDKPMVLTLKKKEQDEDHGPAVLGDVYSDSVTKSVKVQGVEFEVTISANVQVIDGKEGAYSIWGSLRRKGQKFSETITSVSTKTADGLKEVVSISGWSKKPFWIDQSTKKVGRAELQIEVNEHKPFEF